MFQRRQLIHACAQPFRRQLVAERLRHARDNIRQRAVPTGKVVPHPYRAEKVARCVRGEKAAQVDWDGQHDRPLFMPYIHLPVNGGKQRRGQVNGQRGAISVRRVQHLPHIRNALQDHKRTIRPLCAPQAVRLTRGTLGRTAAVRPVILLEAVRPALEDRGLRLSVHTGLRMAQRQVRGHQRLKKADRPRPVRKHMVHIQTGLAPPIADAEQQRLAAVIQRRAGRRMLRLY